MGNLVENRFNIDNYPKSYGSVKIDDYRLRNYFNIGDDLHLIFRELREFCYERAARHDIVTEFKNYNYINSGWEWSVFKKDEHTVLKIPSGIFPEINDPLYIENTAFAYRCISDYYPKEFIPRTVFKTVDNTNLIEQEFILSQEKIIINSHTKNTNLLNCINELLINTLKIIKDVDWIPDINLQRTENGYCLENVRFEKTNGLLKIIDFTHYFDRSRMYPEKTKDFLDIQKQKINDLLVWMKTNNQRKGQYRPQ